MTTVFDLVASLSLNTKNYDDSLDSSEKKGSKFGKGLKSAFETIGKVSVAALGVASAGVTALVKNSIDSFANYEQLVGGVETLFKNSANIVQKYADNAYKTAGLSANKYMEVVTSFSASLLQSLGGDTQAAAEYADLAITDMADNANKMGTSMEAIQSAYQGFAKQNYTMLDNLKLGYGGTKTEMDRLIQDAEALDSTFKATRDENGELAMSYADIVQAIHIVQDNLGITGTTAKEASETISGSAASMKSAWANLATGIADENANIDGLIDNFVKSVSTFSSNIIPRIEQALKGVGKLISGLAPVIANTVPELISEVLPALLEAAISLISSFGEAMIENLPMLIDTAVQIIMTLASYLIESVAPLALAAVDLILALSRSLLAPENIAAIINAALSLMLSLADGLLQAIPVLIEAIPEIVSNVVTVITEALPTIIEAGVTLFTSLISALPSIIDSLVGATSDIISNVITAVIGMIPQIIQAGITLFTSLIAELPSIIKSIAKAIPEIISGIVTAITEALPVIIEAGINLFIALIEALPEIIDTIIDGLDEIILAILDAIIGALPQLVEAGVTLFLALIENLPEIITAIVKAVVSIGENIIGGFEEWGPKLLEWGTELWDNLKSSMVDAWGNIKEKAVEVWEKIKTAVTEPIEAAKDKVKEMIDKIKGFFDFDWSLPPLKLPHLTITGSFSLNPPKVPKFSIDWYAKAMNDGMILNGATIFGMGKNGNLLGGGEVGSEVVVGTNSLMDMIRQASSGQTINVTNYFEITQNQGEDIEELAERISEIVGETIKNERMAFA